MKNTSFHRSERSGTCLKCGGKTPRRSAKFCTRACWKKWVVGRHRRSAPRPPCVMCDEPCRTLYNRFCSKWCFCKWRKLQLPKQKAKRIHKTCELCQTPFLVLPWEAKKRIFCGRSCYHEARVVDMENTTNTSIATNSWRRWRKVILARDKWICVFCGRMATSVHHLRPRSMGGTHEKKNLASVCRRCHSALDKTIEIIVRLNPKFDLDAWLAEFAPTRR